jgi:large subunit ribosomal protein L21
MFAVIETGGKQYKVGKGDVIFVEKLDGDAGATITFDKVMMVGDAGARTIGKPYVAGAAVTAEVLEQTRAPKIIVFRKKRRQNFRRKRGHRQRLSVLRITEISTGKAA